MNKRTPSEQLEFDWQGTIYDSGEFYDRREPEPDVAAIVESLDAYTLPHVAVHPDAGTYGLHTSPPEGLVAVYKPGEIQPPARQYGADTLAEAFTLFNLTHGPEYQRTLDLHPDCLNSSLTTAQWFKVHGHGSERAVAQNQSGGNITTGTAQGRTIQELQALARYDGGS